MHNMNNLEGKSTENTRMISVMRRRLPFIVIGLVAGLAFDAFTAFAWVGPTATAPGNNVAAPVNVGTAPQIKNGDLTTNSHFVYGDLRLNYGWNTTPSTITYLNFSNAQYPTAPTWGVSGYGIRDNNGTLEFKNVGGTWASLQSLISSGSSQWTSGAGGAIYYNGGSVGINTPTPAGKLYVQGGSNGSGTTVTINERTRNDSDTSFLVQAGAASGDFAVKTNGNVGIGGTLSPGARLDVTSPDNTQGTAIATFAANNRSQGISAYWDGIGQFANTQLTFKVGGSEKMRIDSSGNVGIGSTNVSGRKLDVYTPGTNGDAITFGQDADNTETIQSYIDGQWANRASYAGGCCNLLKLNPDVGDVQIGGSITVLRNGTINGAPTFTSAIRANGNMLMTNTSPTIYFVDSDHRSAMIHNNSNLLYVLRGCGTGSESWCQLNGVWPFVINLEDNNATFGASVYAASFIYTSDARLKENIHDLDAGIVTLMKLHPVSFTWKKDIAGPNAGKNDIGLIAQEVEKILPGIVHTDDKGYKSIDYVRLVPVLIKSVQDQEQTIESQQTKIDSLETRIAALEAKLGK